MARKKSAWYSSIVALNIKDPATDRLARELAAATGESITDALRVAIEERLARVRTRPRPPSEATILDDIVSRGRARTDRAHLSEDEILGYGPDGLPR